MFEILPSMKHKLPSAKDRLGRQELGQNHLLVKVGEELHSGLKPFGDEFLINFLAFLFQKNE